MSKKKRIVKSKAKKREKESAQIKEAAQPMLEGIKAFMQKFRNDVSTKKENYQNYARKFKKPKTK